jgi:hypothetical protein
MPCPIVGDQSMPRVKMTPWRKVAMTVLQFYLVVLLVLIFVRFLRIFQ